MGQTDRQTDGRTDASQQCLMLLPFMGGSIITEPEPENLALNRRGHRFARVVFLTALTVVHPVLTIYCRNNVTLLLNCVAQANTNLLKLEPNDSGYVHSHWKECVQGRIFQFANSCAVHFSSCCKQTLMLRRAASCTPLPGCISVSIGPTQPFILSGSINEMCAAVYR